VPEPFVINACPFVPSAEGKVNDTSLAKVAGADKETKLVPLAVASLKRISLSLSIIKLTVEVVAVSESVKTVPVAVVDSPVIDTVESTSLLCWLYGQ
jgi:hypothetical protein